jgi:chromosome partitioning protein
LRHGLSTDVYDNLKKVFGNDLLDTKIRINIAIAKSQGERKNIFDYDSSSNGARDYMELVNEILEREEV